MTSLLAQGFDIPNYWTLQGNKAEVDFMIASKLAVIPIEVKSDRRISGTVSLNMTIVALMIIYLKL